MAAIDRAGAVDLQVIDEKPEDVVARFFFEAVRPRLGAAFSRGMMWAAYKQWCADRRIAAVSHAKFGKLARWRKDRIGGAVWYWDCQLAPHYVGLALAQAPKTLPRPGVMEVH